MRSHATLTRLHVPDELGVGTLIDLPRAQSHFLGVVMRLKTGALVRVFNGADGEWRAALTQIGKRSARLEILERLRQPPSTPDIWLLFAPVKKARNDFIVEKATELGASLIRPILTRRTTTHGVKLDRMRLQIIEAAEQTERLDLPELVEPIDLMSLIGEWDPSRALIFADEAGDAKPAVDALKAISAPAAILIGPEGGFDPQERQILREQTFVTPINLGPRILRADTAVVATMAVWQAVSGDWQN